MTQEAVAERLHMVPRHYQKIEAGELNVTLSTLCKLALALRVKPRTLLDDD
jgi:transcriptional regulator with XRE-family HTH domain